MTRLPDPISRRDRQRQTREALVFAARAVFARDGYSGANLELIAREAGFSKGAVYSNFDGKAGLFLAVMDLNIETALAEGGWDVFERTAQDAPPEGQDPALAAAMTGVALATLEFVATAARDEQLAGELAKRMEKLTDVYTSIAAESRVEGDPLSDADLGALLTALDQGSALLMLAGSVAIDQRVLRAGMQRLLDPAATRGPAGAEGDDTGAGPPALHDEVVRRRIAAALGEGREA
ncbi:TetR/AcrR family transcriptional regulator [Georgenia sp. MJ170]|uniref:TetR/AcrR family transcriptional regulator n=1 Tax=Georgenia sunbinii TaxID=3117728 RepID=UPI002F26373D